jgi:hypothetical protein
VCIRLMIDGFMPYNTSATSYSCWPIFAIPYNLSHSLCMKYEYIFPCLIIPDPDHLGTCLNVMFKPLIEELKQLCEGDETYDYDQKQKFNLRVTYIGSIHDFRTYNMFLECSCNRILTFPICVKDTTCFHLKLGEGERSLTLIVINVFYP